MNVHDLQTLLDYHYWARDRVLDGNQTLDVEQYNRDLGSSFKSVRETATHVYAAEWAWYSRWHGESPTALLPADRFADLAALRAAWIEYEGKLRAYIGALTDVAINQAIEFKLLSGQAGAAPIWQMVQHVVNHASYHRGQLTTMLRQLAAPPAKPMDLIAYYRQQAARG